MVVAIDGYSVRQNISLHVHLGHSDASLQQLGKIPIYHRLIRNQRGLRYSLPQAKSFIIDEEKGLVLLNWDAKGGAELVLFVGRFLRSNDDERRSVKSVVPQIFENIAVIIIGARLDHGIQYCPIASSEFRAVIVGLNFKFLDGVDGGLNYVRRLIQHI